MQHKLPGLCPTLVQEALLMPPRAGVWLQDGSRPQPGVRAPTLPSLASCPQQKTAWPGVHTGVSPGAVVEAWMLQARPVGGTHGIWWLALSQLTSSPWTVRGVRGSLIRVD